MYLIFIHGEETSRNVSTCMEPSETPVHEEEPYTGGLGWDNPCTNICSTSSRLNPSF
jgi:hypothetical protein